MCSTANTSRRRKWRPNTNRSAADFAQVTAWLSGQGFTITRPDDHHLAVFAQGTVSQIQAALGVTFARVSDGTTEFTSALTAPSVPAAISPLLVGINGLQPHLHPHTHLLMQTNSLTGTNPPYLPSQIAQAYDATPLYTNGVTGSGQTIAIVINTFPSTSDLTSFWSTYGVSQSLSNITFIQVISGHLSSPSGEETLDTEWTSSVAYGAKVRVYAVRSLTSTNIDARLLSDQQRCYGHAFAQSHRALDELWHRGNLRGPGPGHDRRPVFYLAHQRQVSLFASSGDGGATPGSTGHTGTGSLQVESPASDPYVTRRRRDFPHAHQQRQRQHGSRLERSHRQRRWRERRRRERIFQPARVAEGRWRALRHRPLRARRGRLGRSQLRRRGIFEWRSGRVRRHELERADVGRFFRADQSIPRQRRPGCRR